MIHPSYGHPATPAATGFLCWALFFFPGAAAGADTPDTIIGRDVSPVGEFSSPTIVTLDVAGAEPVGPESYESVLLSKPGGILNEGLLDHDRNALETLFREMGWWQAAVGVTVDSTAAGPSVTFTVTRGAPAILGNVRITGPDPVPLWAGVAAPSGGLFSNVVLTALVDTITENAAQDGFPDITVKPVLTARSDTVEVTLQVSPGAPAAIDSFAVTGLTRTRDRVVLREIESLRGRRADRAALAQARAIIGRMDYIDATADPLILYPPDGPATLLVVVDEGPQGSFDGVFGYQPGTGGEGGEMVGSIDLSFPNLLGTGRSAAVKWENLGKNTGDMELRYREPWLLGRPYSLSGAFMQEQRDLLDYTKTTMQVSVTRAFGSIEAGAGYRYEKVSADSLASSSAHGGDLTIRWTSLDNPANPRSGIRYGAAWSHLVKSPRFGGDTHRIERTEFDLDHFLPTLERQTIALMIRYRHVSAPSQSLTLADRYWLGGTTSIRGYRERILPAVEAFWANIEYRFLERGRSRVFVFYDFGHLINEEETPPGKIRRVSIDRSGWGFGLRIDSRAGTLGFDLAFGEGDSLGDGKLHAGLSNYF